ncbi:enamine deaminase RidA (YjgF/YER057c/UK114 family) [Isoptericola jiangsuensis]|uniref:Enamine deaminase RidA (YjgF/YER057c/UK114 family) n=2 Tax=Isoptericola jiangsuensis TaxID=548579 RepID=A0A2A9F221_9MICO|nr:enamine deaminase RidA (YjgF/YER057c/UK114 family) [Isoptericola jiangsuensis]
MSGMSVDARLAELGITLPAVAAPVAAYQPAVRSGAHVYTAGQLPFVDGALPVTGKVGDGDGLVDPATAADLARTCALNALAAVRSVAGTLEGVRIVKVTGFVASDPSFTGQPGVLNGASTVLGEIFGDAGTHARSAVGVAVLPLDAPVEVEIIAELPA